MNRDSIYFRQVQLLVRVLPLVAKEACFALKGGTAINLFIRDLPRLSVDIDLVYLPLDDRDTAIRNVREALTRIARDIESTIAGSKTIASYESSDALRLTVEAGRVRIKIELSPVLRGTIYPPELKVVREKVEDTFGFAEIPVLALPDLYAGKICAALDRQHPRDLFDVKLLLENEGFGDDLRKAFLVYLISHNRTMAELLDPPRKDIRSIYEGEFLNMAEISVTREELEEVRERLITTIHAELTSDEKHFLLSFKSKVPEWTLLGVDGVEKLPAVRWKMINLLRMSKDKHDKAFKILENILKD
jgi:predicted nucleotidyltransferase component of viral defense system